MTAARTNRWTGESAVHTDASPAELSPGGSVLLTVRRVTEDADAVWCRGGKLATGSDVDHPLAPAGLGRWSALLPIARNATSGPIRLFLYVQHQQAIERHDITAATVRTVRVEASAPAATARTPSTGCQPAYGTGRTFP